ncbi:hypothetical protein C0992_003398 [Termitomyces sp. T32_za158]|nr:hypothetical protein C0992_003398 [Termitomyces sp. T32_za158]
MKDWAELEGAQLKKEDVELRKSENLTDIGKRISELEKAYEAYALIIDSDSVFQTSELPSILPIIKKLQQMKVDGRCVFAASLEKLLERWTATPCFPTESS